MTTTAFVLAIMIALPLAWEGYAISQSDLQTISEVWATMGREWSPFFAYALSVLVGHFFIRPTHNVASYLAEPGEVFVVLFVGWAIFWGFRAYPQALPLSTTPSFVLTVGGILIGAFVWTIGA